MCGAPHHTTSENQTIVGFLLRSNLRRQKTPHARVHLPRTMVVLGSGGLSDDSAGVEGVLGALPIERQNQPRFGNIQGSLDVADFLR